MGFSLYILVWRERLGIKLKEFTFYRSLYSLFDSLANRFVFKLPFIHREVLGQMTLFANRDKLEKYVEKYEEET